MRKKLLFGVFFIIIFIIMLIMPNKSLAATNGYEVFQMKMAIKL